MLTQHRLALLHALVIHQPAEVVPDRHLELGLVVELVDHAQVGHQATRERTVGGFRDTGCAGLALQAVDAAAEVGRSGLRNRGQ